MIFVHLSGIEDHLQQHVYLFWKYRIPKNLFPEHKVLVKEYFVTKDHLLCYWCQIRAMESKLDWLDLMPEQALRKLLSGFYIIELLILVECIRPGGTSYLGFKSPAFKREARITC